MVDNIKIFLVLVLLVVGYVGMEVMHMGENYNQIARSEAESAIHQFVDMAHSKGYIDPTDYKLLMSRLTASGEVFEVSLEHNKKRYQPEYINPNDFSTFQEKFEVLYEGYYTRDILGVLFPSGNIPEDDHSRRYVMNPGDMFTVVAESRGTTFANATRTFLGLNTGGPISINYGGMVRNEAP